MTQQPVIQCCSINGKICRNGKRDDFSVDERTGEKYFCNEWVNVKGKHPQTGEVLDNFMCAKYANVLMALEQAQQTRQAAASSDKVANEVRSHHATFFSALNDETRARLLKADDVKHIEVKENENGI